MQAGYYLMGGCRLSFVRILNVSLLLLPTLENLYHTWPIWLWPYILSRCIKICEFHDQTLKVERWFKSEANNDKSESSRNMIGESRSTRDRLSSVGHHQKDEPAELEFCFCSSIEQFWSEKKMKERERWFWSETWR